MKLRGVDFWADHNNTMMIFDEKGFSGPNSIIIEERVRTGMPFRVVVNSPSGDLNKIVSRRSASKKVGLTMIIDVRGKKDDKLYYRVEMNCLLLYVSIGDDKVTMTVQPREIYETYFTSRQPCISPTFQANKSLYLVKHS